MGFARQGVWVMGYHGLMGYGVQIPAHQLGGPKKAMGFQGLWVIRSMGYKGFNCNPWPHSTSIQKEPTLSVGLNSLIKLNQLQSRLKKLAMLPMVVSIDVRGELPFFYNSLPSLGPLLDNETHTNPYP